MRKIYESPTVTMAGSVRDLTRANLVGRNPDNLTVITLHIPGIGEIDIPGTGGLPSGITTTP